MGARYGPQTYAGDKFELGPLMRSGALVLGRRTWELFASRWPSRTGEFPDAMNGAAKLVASRTLTDVSAWANSTLIDGDLCATLEREREDRDLIVVGSTSIVHALSAQDLIDEYRLLILPSIVGGGMRVFAPDTPAQQWELLSAEASDGKVLVRYQRARGEQLTHA
jgi:dihydrofolate reductase